MKTLILFIAIFAVSALAQDTCNADIKWRNCPRKARNCDACFIAVFSYQGGSRKERDIMCMKSTSPNACIYTGNMLSDKSFAVVTGKNGKCTPFSEDPLEVRQFFAP